jgi:peptidyl-prolyl cis-trans isomerase SurA
MNSTFRHFGLILGLPLVLATFAGFAAGPAPTAPAAEEAPLVDRIVAVVNNDVITLSELGDRTNLIAAQLSKQGMALPERSILQRQVLEKLIFDTAQKQYAKEIGLQVDDSELDHTIERIAQDNKLALPAFRETVEKGGVTFAKFREEIRTEMLLARLREREVDSRIVVTDSEVDNQLKQEQALGSEAQVEYHLSHILVVVPENMGVKSLEAYQKKIEAAQNQLKQGVPFAQVAASFSEAPDALSGGDLGWRPASRLPTVFAEVLSHMKPGENSQILRSSNGFHIVHLSEQRGAQTGAPVTQYHVRQILLKSSTHPSEAELKTQIRAIHTRLTRGEDFAKVAIQESEDESRSGGGDLGWLTEGDLPPQLENTLKALSPGKISEPFETPYGMHIVQLLDTRKSEASDESRKMLIRKGLRARKADEAFENWLHQLRDSAFVDIRFDDR